MWERFWWRHRSFSCRTKFGVRVTGHTRDIIQRYIYYFGVWEPSITQWAAESLRPGDCFVDVGANIGYYSLLASSLVGAGGKVVSIEADPAIYTLLRRNVEQNGAENIRTISAAVAAERGTLRLFHGPDDNIGTTSTVRQNSADQGVEVTAAPLHELLQADEIALARIIKIDVEGGELPVLQGLMPMLDRLREDAEILVETAPTSAEAILALMRSRGFSAYSIDNYYKAEWYFENSVARPQPVEGGAVRTQTDLLFSRRRY